MIIKNSCGICGSKRARVVYKGRIRTGKFNELSSDLYKVVKCSECGVAGLRGMTSDIKSYYETSRYHREVEDRASVKHYFAGYNPEEPHNLKTISMDVFRGKVVCDIGCGRGFFMDLVKGMSKETIGIEPAKLLRNSLVKKGYKVFPYLTDALSSYRNGIDLAFSFSVIEHIEDPVGFLKDIKGLLRNRGKIFLSTPNSNDLLLELLPDTYTSLFYRKAHLWYFDTAAISNILERAGYSRIKISHYQRFGLGNFMMWLRDRRPRGDVRPQFITDTMDSAWRAELERTGRSDYLFAEAGKG